jgi:hypothetical protein
MKARRKPFISKANILKSLRALFLSSAVSLGILAGFPWLQVVWRKSSVIAVQVFLPGHIWIFALISGMSATASAILLLFPRVSKSLRLGLLSPIYYLWITALALFDVFIGRRHYFSAVLTLVVSACLTYVANILRERPSPSGTIEDPIDPDLPVAEDGTDLLNRAEIINGLASIVLREQPSVAALIGGYGDGKTSVLNLTIGKLKQIEEHERPVIVKFSPWLPANSNALVISLLSSIVAEIRKIYVMPGLNQGALLYARSLLTIVPKMKAMEALLKEPSQQERVRQMARQIANMPRRIVVILDDLDRMEAKELETVFKILRGSENLSSVTFVCSFDDQELALILKSTRRYQDTHKFIHKFFQIKLGLPKIESLQIKTAFAAQISHLATKFLREPNVEKLVDQLWEGGAERHLVNLRTVKLFANKIRYSLHIIGKEVNFGDFLRLELIRDIHSDLYETIYAFGQYFYNAEMAFETWGKRLHPLDSEKDKKVRADFYDALKKKVPTNKQYVFSLLAELFPSFDEYENKFSRFDRSGENPETERRLFHPRYFRQYFLFRVPTELFSEEQYSVFCSAIKNANEQKAAAKFNEVFDSVITEEFKRWHFMHLIDMRQSEFSVDAAKGLARGAARRASYWSRDAFEFDIAIRMTYQALLRIKDSSERQKLLRAIVDESSSILYSLYMIWVIETTKDAVPAIVEDIVAIKPYLQCRVETEYLTLGAPIIYDQFKDIDAHQVLFAWGRLGPEGTANARQYIHGILAANPTALDKLLKLMFRVEFIDDYAALKPLFDYDEIARLIDENKEKLDPEKVKQFQDRHHRADEKNSES